jgi:hypothetical protein
MSYQCDFSKDYRFSIKETKNIQSIFKLCWTIPRKIPHARRGKKKYRKKNALLLSKYLFEGISE